MEHFAKNKQMSLTFNGLQHYDNVHLNENKNHLSQTGDDV